MAGLDPIAADCGGCVVVSRDGFGDVRRVRLRPEQITGACMAVARGGDWEWLPEPSPAVYVPAALYPFGWRSGKHGPREGNMLLILERDGSDPLAYSRLVDEAGKTVHTREFAERKRAKIARRRARARSAEGPLAA